MASIEDGSASEPAPVGGEHDLTAAVFDGLDRAGVRWALLRGRSTLGEPGGDVDLLVAAEDLDSFEDVVFELGAFVLPRMRVPTSWSRAVLRHSWHRFYVVSTPSSGVSLKLDVVTQLVYNKQKKLVSELEDGCLARRVEDGGVHVLDPTDHFWTVLLHCLLDKRHVAPHRAAELESVVTQVVRPSAGEEFFDSLCPPGYSADEAVAQVLDRDWEALLATGRLILSPGEGSAREESATSAPGPVTQRRRGGAGQAAPRLARGLRAAAVSAYPAVWRRAGLGVVPRVLDIVEEGAVDATVVRLRRRPARCEISLLTSVEQRRSLAARLRSEYYVPVRGRWHRLTTVGLERVSLVTAEQLGLSLDVADQVRRTSVPMAGRTHCRRAAPGPWLDAVAEPARTRPVRTPPGAG